jgi:hypothetical protein
MLLPPNSILLEIALKLVADIRNRTFSQSDLLRAVAQMTEDQQSDFFEVCCNVHAKAVSDLLELDRPDTYTNYEIAVACRAKIIATEEIANAAEALCELSTFFDDHKIRGSIRFNSRFLET